MKLTVFWFVNSSDKWTRLIFIVIWSLSNANKMSIACYHSSKRRSMRWVRKTEPFVTDFPIPLQKKNHSLVLSFSSLFLYFFIFFYNDGFHLLSRQKIWEPMCENWLLHHNVDENSKSGKSGKPGTFDRMEVEKFEKLTVWYIFKDAFYMWLYAWWFKRKKSVKKEKESYFSDRF